MGHGTRPFCGGAVLGVVAVFLCPATALQAQDGLEAQTGEPPQTIDILAERPVQGPEYEDCSDEQEAAAISGEIVICRRKSDQDQRLYSNEEAQDRYAEKTKGPMPMDVNLKDMAPMVGIGAIFRGCFIPPCPRPMPILIDLEALPEAPPGSDADRIARGLAPRGRETGPVGGDLVAGEELRPEAPPPAGAASEISPSGSASPAAEPSG